MGKLGENVPLLIDKIPSGIPDESVPLYLQRLEYYRRLYRPKQVEGQ
ncbi:MAG: hypothetical protein E6152_14090 [Escherichia coli]|nr:hypothetical protein [Escherichia coli]